ncbi:MAG TPA: DUF4231 domain-containing protein [Candidatus Dormibacteraeota bacterium]|nr:DUF4231 domain-containing protein [Candidatus Dormibacteraeota bacterium]
MTAVPQGSSSSKERLEAILDSIDITPFQKGLLRERWLDQVTWMGAQARRTRRRFLLYRIPVVVGGALTPALVTILLTTHDPTIGWLGGIPVDVIRFLAFSVSLIVAACAGAEEVLKFGDRWRHYRRTAELLKTLGWQYLMLNGGFRRYSSHAAAFTAFTERVEDTLNEDVEGYLATMAGDGPEGGRRHEVVA